MNFDVGAGKWQGYQHGSGSNHCHADGGPGVPPLHGQHHLLVQVSTLQCQEPPEQLQLTGPSAQLLHFLPLHNLLQSSKRRVNTDPDSCAATIWGLLALMSSGKQIFHTLLHLSLQLGQQLLPIPVEHGHEQVSHPVHSFWQSIQEAACMGSVPRSTRILEEANTYLSS